MSSVSIQKVPKPEIATSLLQSMEVLFEDVRRHAFERFQRRGALDGWDLEDWFRAERDLIWLPKSELVEWEKEFEMKVEVPALEAKELRISALPDAIVVQAVSSRKDTKKQGKVHYSELSEKRLFRRFQLPAPIDVEQVKATLNKGVLRIVAAKARAAKGKAIPIAA